MVKPKTKKNRYTLAVYELLYAMLLNKDYFRIYLNELGYLLNKEERESVRNGYYQVDEFDRDDDEDSDDD